MSSFNVFYKCFASFYWVIITKQIYKKYINKTTVYDAGLTSSQWLVFAG